MANTWVVMPGPCTLLRHEEAVFIGTVTDERPKGHYYFRVDERFKGAKEDYFDVEGLPFADLIERFQVGKQYLVFAIAWPYSSKDERIIVAQWPTRELRYAQALIDQVRAEKGGKRNAAVYGTLLEVLSRSGGDSEVRPVAGAVVRMRSRDKSFETRTDERGVYALERLPSGTYQFSMDLPPTLQMEPSESFEAFELPRHSCYERDISVKFSGKVMATAESELAAGITEREKGKYPSALEYLQRAVALDPQLVEAHFALASVADGMCLPNADPGPDMHKCELAIQEYNKVIELDASRSDALKNLAYLLYQFNRLDEAESLYRRALALRADDPELLCAVAATTIHRVWPDLAAAKAGMNDRPWIDSRSCDEVRERNQARIGEGLTFLMRALSIQKNNLDLIAYLRWFHTARAQTQCGNRQEYEAEMNAAIECDRLEKRVFRRKGWHNTFQKCPPGPPPMPGHPKLFKTTLRANNP